MSPSGGSSSSFSVSETNFNLALLDPPKWGWTAVGPVQNVMTPQEAMQRKFRKKNRYTKRKSVDANVISSLVSSTNAANNNNNSNSNNNTKQTISAPDNPPSVSQSFLMTPATPSIVVLNTAATDPMSQPLPPPSTALASPNEPTPPTPSATPTAKATPPPVSQQTTEREVSVSSNNTDASSNNSHHPRTQLHSSDFTSLKIQNKQYHVQSGVRLDSDGNEFVDMYTYHGGREGMEPQPLPPTDTGSAWSEPRLKVHIKIQFDLGGDDDEDDDDDDDDNDSGGNQSPTNFVETIEWDLATADLTPMQYAANVAQEFGLEFGEMMNVATSIQTQINEHLRSIGTYNVPLAHPKQRAPLCHRPLQLYGAPLSFCQGGLMLPEGKRGRSAVPKKVQPKPPRGSIGGFGAPSKPSGACDVDGQTDDSAAIDPELRNEVIHRAKLACRKELRATCVSKRTNFMCHICHSKQPVCGVFPCSLKTHAYCIDHMKEHMGIDLEDPTSSREVTHCPICCLTCSCAKCYKKLSGVTLEFKKRMIAQGSDMETTAFEGILQYCIGLRGRMNTPKASSLSSLSRRSDENNKGRKVKKVPPIDFPEELCGGRNLEPGTELDYRSVFTSKGQKIKRVQDMPQQETAAAVQVQVQVQVPVPPAAKPATTKAKGNSDPPEQMAEDGNVDYCQLCRKAGNLLCCDFCPRGFHESCLGEANKTNPVPPSSSGDKWECITCKREKAGISEDLVTGLAEVKVSAAKSKFAEPRNCRDVIATALVKYEHSDKFLETVNVLAMIYEMVTKLIKYDFGYIFEAPVNTRAVPEYKKIVKKPMDLGTIANRMAKGVSYTKCYDKSKNWDDVIVAILQDIELVWHNCFTFNYEGSSIYRMAEVHRRRSRNTRKKSFDHLLSEDVKKRVDEYVAKCDHMRSPEAVAAAVAAAAAAAEKAAEKKWVRQKSQHKITVPLAAKKMRTIVVLDPDTGAPVKFYTTLRAAVSAVVFMARLGHTAEWLPLTDHSIKQAIRQGSKDPRRRIFGYRWMFYDELLSGQAKFAQDEDIADTRDWIIQDRGTIQDMIQLSDGDVTYLFLSIEEALSFSDIPKEVPVAEIRKRLLEAPYNKWVPLVGFKWQKLKLPLKEEKVSADVPDKTTKIEAKGTREPNGTEGDGLSACKGGHEDGNDRTRDSEVSTNPSMAKAAPFPSGGPNHEIFNLNDMKTPSLPGQHNAIIKADILSGRRLVGFDNLDSAYQDWLRAIRTSPAFSTNQPLTLDVFEKHYVIGQQNVDGLVWSAKRRNGEPLKKAEKPTKPVMSPGFYASKPIAGDGGSDEKPPRVSTSPVDTTGRRLFVESSSKPADSAAETPVTKKAAVSSSKASVLEPVAASKVSAVSGDDKQPAEKAKTDSIAVHRQDAERSRSPGDSSSRIDPVPKPSIDVDGVGRKRALEATQPKGASLEEPPAKKQWK